MRKKMPTKWQMWGFTLIELLIVVAIVAILAAIAYPSYQEQVRKTRRADAQSVLFENAQFLERNYTTAGRYDQNAGGTAIAVGDLPHDSAPPGTGAGDRAYEITLASTQTTFTLTATPRNAQVGDRCGNLTLNYMGTRGCTGAGMDCIEQCWR